MKKNSEEWFKCNNNSNKPDEAFIFPMSNFQIMMKLCTSVRYSVYFESKFCFNQHYFTKENFDKTDHYLLFPRLSPLETKKNLIYILRISRQTTNFVRGQVNLLLGYRYHKQFYYKNVTLYDRIYPFDGMWK